ncbi:hypothetical protein [Inhella proteolytica]|uniref:Integrase n=1 Tax=Inhella proteolytica TaxID=2795029 RepID=A0A931J4R3_9BURK|nr:hypothetical protein [Inhella proteolytica]MBH9578708.1 hypothetical protein [Inhella proteolytica]
MLRFTARDLVDDALQLKQGKTNKKLRILLSDSQTGRRTEQGQLVDRLRAQPVRSIWLLNSSAGQPLSKGMLRVRFIAARAAAAKEAEATGDLGLAARINELWFADARPKAASEIDDLRDAQKLLGHSSERITKIVYRRRGERVKPTR